MDREYLNQCIGKYWRRWASFAHKQCYIRSIPQESYDVMAEALSCLLEQPESELNRLIEAEKQEDTALLSWVFSAIVFRAKSNGERCRRTLLREKFDTDLSDSCPVDYSDDLFTVMREMEASMREDCFIQPGALQYTGRGRLFKYFQRYKVKGGEIRYSVHYEARRGRGKGERSSFSSREKAVAFLASM